MPYFAGKHRSGTNKLNREGRALVHQLIADGKSNHQINHTLVEKGLLAEGDALSRNALWVYRKKVFVEPVKYTLTLEAEQVVVGTLSEAVIHAAELNREATAALLDDDGRLRPLSEKQLMTYFKIYLDTFKCLQSLGIVSASESAPKAACQYTEEQRVIIEVDGIIAEARKLYWKYQEENALNRLGYESPHDEDEEDEM